MSDTPETLDAILAEMRDGRSFRLDGADVPWCLLLNLADRIEAAAERERDEDRQLAAIAESDESFARCARCDRPERAPGNAAMREALVEILDRTNLEKERDYDAALNGGILEIHDIANTALNQTKGE